MRFASVFVSFLAALVSLLLIFSCYREKTAIETMDSKFASIQEQTAKYESDVQELQTSVADLKEKQKIAQERLSVLQTRENYKTEPTVFLTFDYAFSANYTLEEIETLDQNGIKGTFFVIGSGIKNSETMKTALKEAFNNGHKIGIRSYSDELSTVYANEEAYFNDLYACRDLILEITGEAPVLVRMPGGTATAEARFKRSTGSEDTFKSVLARLEKEGFIVNDWTVDSGDSASVSAAAITANVLAGSSKTLNATYKTSIPLFTSSRSAKALQDVIDGLRQQGYTFSALPNAICISRQR